MDVEELKSKWEKSTLKNRRRRSMPSMAPRHTVHPEHKPKPNNQKKRNGPPPWVIAKQQRERIAQMDDADRAKEIEQLHRRAALEMAKRHPEPPQQIVDGWVVCIDCVTPLQPERLKAKPDAARCVECQSIEDKKGKHRG